MVLLILSASQCRRCVVYRVVVVYSHLEKRAVTSRLQRKPMDSFISILLLLITLIFFISYNDL